MYTLAKSEGGGKKFTIKFAFPREFHSRFFNGFLPGFSPVARSHFMFNFICYLILQRRCCIMERKGILEFIKKCLSDPNYNTIIFGNPKIVAIMKRVLRIINTSLYVKDINKRAQSEPSWHQLRFRLLYLSKNTMSHADIAERTEVDRINKYVDNYNETALNIIDVESMKNINYAILLQEYFKSEYVGW